MRRRAYVMLAVAQWLLLIEAAILMIADAWRDAVVCILIGYAVAIAIPVVKPKPLTLDEQIEREVAKSRHPAGRKRAQ